ncbi:MAG: HlyD family efflux transporter periplasmic adaptor subunit [Verrucomicrobiales bacterium]|nr:HlyD family efflux transporter periplasmic adaptor subunit [Verrucomicrobiales bacterium]
MNLQKANVFFSGVVCLLLGALIAVVLLQGKGTPGSAEEQPDDAEQKIITVETETATPTNSFSIPREYSGIIQSARTMDVGFSRAGQIIEMDLEVGDLVDEGQVIAKLDTRRLELQKDAYEEALDQPVNPQQPPAGKPVTQTDLDLVNLDLEDSELKVPFDATVTIRHMNVGSMASPGHPVVRLVERGNLEALVSLPGDVAVELREGDRKELQVGDQTITAEVQAVLPEVDLTTRTQTVLFSLDEATAEEVTAGDVVRLRLDREETGAGFWLPLSALTREMRGLWSVFVVEKDEKEISRVARRYLEVIHVEGDRARVRGMDAKEFEYIAKGVHRVVPGQRIRREGEVLPEDVETKEGETTAEEEAAAEETAEAESDPAPGSPAPEEKADEVEEGGAETEEGTTEPEDAP